MVATLIKEKGTIGQAKEQLGHSSDIVTSAHYIKRAHEGPVVRDIL
jgi:hypothetical protein